MTELALAIMLQASYKKLGGGDRRTFIVFFWCELRDACYGPE